MAIRKYGSGSVEEVEATEEAPAPDNEPMDAEAVLAETPDLDDE